MITECRGWKEEGGGHLEQQSMILTYTATSAGRISMHPFSSLSQYFIKHRFMLAFQQGRTEWGGGDRLVVMGGSVRVARISVLFVPCEALICGNSGERRAGAEGLRKRCIWMLWLIGKFLKGKLILNWDSKLQDVRNWSWGRIVAYLNPV